MVNLFEEYPIIVSNLFLLIICSSAALLRAAIKAYIPDDNITRLVLLEYVASLELCTTVFEFAFIATISGIWTYGLQFFLFTVWWSYVWDEESACPSNVIADVIEGKRSFGHAFLLIFAQTLAGLFAFAHIAVLWNLGLTQAHKNKLTEPGTADLQVCVIAAAAIECFGSFVCGLVGKILGDMDCPYSNIISAFFSTAMVLVAFNYTGQFNQSNASSLNVGCEENTSGGHIIVYWIGGLLGSLLSLYVHKKILAPNCTDETHN